MKFDEKLKPSMVFLLVVVPIGLMVLFGYYNRNKFESVLRTNSSLTIGKVNGFNNHRKIGERLEFEFEFNGKLIYSSSKCSDFAWRNFEGSYKILYPKIRGRFFPVLFSKDDPTNYSKILVTAADFKEYDLLFPDSLTWVEKILLDY